MTTIVERPGSVARRPVTTYVLWVLATGLPLLAVAIALDLPQEPFLLPITYLGLTGGALVLTRRTRGPGAVRALLAQLLIWRFGAARWFAVALAMPLLTTAVALATGTYRGPARGWVAEAGLYLLLTFVVGALVLNLWEELGWAGFVQARLTDRHGLLTGALLTAVPFAALHVPRAFTPGWTWSSAAVTLGAVVLFVPFFRYLLGMLYADTRGSLLAVGVMHASFNASSGLGTADGGWQYIPAMIVLTVVVALTRRPAAGARASAAHR